MNWNLVQIGGRLTREPQLRNMPSGMAVCDFGVATNRNFKSSDGEKREEVAFVDVTAFGAQAETINKFFHKGMPIFISGRLRYSTWEDKQGGGKRHKLDIVLEQFQFIGKREDNPQSDGDDSAPPQSRKPSQRPPAESPFEGAPPVFDEESIPFAWSGRMSPPI